MTVCKRINGFPPIVSPDARVLILGSMPSVASLSKQQYYGHPRNAFWRIVFSVFGETSLPDYTARCRFLKAHGIALWDVYASCERDGSLDQDIRDEQYNPLSDLIESLPDLQMILCNGTKSYTGFRSYAKEHGIRIPYRQMVSTSPAAARYTLEEKTEQWKILLCYTENFGKEQTTQ